MGNIVKNHHSKFELNATRNDGALGFFQRASPPNNNNNNNNNKISSVWGPVPGPKMHDNTSKAVSNNENNTTTLSAALFVTIPDWHCFHNDMLGYVVPFS